MITMKTSWPRFLYCKKIFTPPNKRYLWAYFRLPIKLVVLGAHLISSIKTIHFLVVFMDKLWLVQLFSPPAHLDLSGCLGVGWHSKASFLGLLVSPSNSYRGLLFPQEEAALVKSKFLIHAFELKSKVNYKYLTICAFIGLWWTVVLVISILCEKTLLGT